MLVIKRVAALRTSSLFIELHDYVLAEIAQIVQETTIDAGSIIIQEGDLEDWMFILIEGRAGVKRGSEIVSQLNPGASVGELSVLDPAPRAATVTALDACLFFRIDQLPFNELMLEQPSVMSALLTVLARQLRSSSPLQQRMY